MRTGSTISYEIEIFDNGFWTTTEQIREGMDGIRHLCADLIEGIDQKKESAIEGVYGEDGLDHQSIFVEPMSVGEAVRRINGCGFATDEDEAEIENLGENAWPPAEEAY